MNLKTSLITALSVLPLLYGAVAAAETPISCGTTDTGAVKRACYGIGSSDFEYGHEVLGDTAEWSAIILFETKKHSIFSQKPVGMILAEAEHIFEDIAPRLFDVDGDGDAEAVVVESNKDLGARLAIYSTVGERKRIAATPYIGRSFRWLSPIGIADFNEDGHIDIAYIDRPHLAKTLRVWTYRDGELIETANTTGLSNHRIGENFISGGVRTCDGTPEMITADAAWKRIIATRFENGKLTKTDLGPFKGKRSFKRALTC